MNVHIHQPSSFTWAEERKCRRCGWNCRHLITSFVWYGPIVICTECGAYRNDGVLRRARKTDGITRRKAREQLATAGTHADFIAWLEAQIAA